MITCLVGNTEVNCFDGIHDKHKLKKWSSKNLLKCPDCGKPYEYCHGEIVSPYFRHKEKSFECDEIFHEPETQEHILGKTSIYNWLISIKDKCNLSNIKLESYIPETKQKPDVYFEQNGQRCVIEFQCTPIASEYIRRKELYSLAKIKDTWVLGVDKYSSGRRSIESDTAISFNSIENSVVLRNKRKFVNDSRIVDFLDRSYDINCFTIKDGEIVLDDIVLKDAKEKYLKYQTDKQMEAEKRQKEETEYNLYIADKSNIIKDLTDKLLSAYNVDFNFKTGSYDKRAYICCIGIGSKYMFIKEDSIDICSQISYLKLCGRKHRRQYRLVTSASYNWNFEDFNLFEKILCDFAMIDYEMKEKMEQISDISNLNILLINGKYRFNNDNVRFRFLKDFSIQESYIYNDFANEIRKLNKRKTKHLVFMIPKYDSYFKPLGFCGYVKVTELEDMIVRMIKRCGFKNIMFVDDKFFDEEE